MNDNVEQAGRAERALHSRIVVGVDGGAAAAAAVRWATEQARVTGMSLHVVHSWQLTGCHLEAGGTSLQRAATADARARATQWVITALGENEAGVRWTLDVVEDAPGPALVAQSREAGLLVLGTGEHVGLRRLVPGSVSRYVLTHASPPIVAVRAPRTN